MNNKQHHQYVLYRHSTTTTYLYYTYIYIDITYCCNFVVIIVMNVYKYSSYELCSNDYFFLYIYYIHSIWYIQKCFIYHGIPIQYIVNQWYTYIVYMVYIPWCTCIVYGISMVYLYSISMVYKNSPKISLNFRPICRS